MPDSARMRAICKNCSYLRYKTNCSASLLNYSNPLQCYLIILVPIMKIYVLHGLFRHLLRDIRSFAVTN